MHKVNEEEKQMCQEIGKRLSELRKLKKMTQSEVGKHLGISQSNMSQLESDVRKFSVYEIKKLIELYDSGYEYVLGKLDKDNDPQKYERPQNTLESVDLLLSICKKAGSDELNKAVAAYLNMCVYYILRELYEANPRNTDAVFSIEKDDAAKRISKFISNTPPQLAAYVKATNGKVKKKEIEPPLERAGDFREFVKLSEDFVSKFLLD